MSSFDIRYFIITIIKSQTSMPSDWDPFDLNGHFTWTQLWFLSFSSSTSPLLLMRGKIFTYWMPKVSTTLRCHVAISHFISQQAWISWGSTSLRRPLILSFLSRLPLWGWGECGTPSPLDLPYSQYCLHLVSSSFYSEILGHTFHTWLPNDYAMIFSHGSTFSTYKRLLTLHKKKVTTFSLWELWLNYFFVVLHLDHSPWSHLQPGGVCSCLILASNVCSLAQVNTELTSNFEC